MKLGGIVKAYAMPGERPVHTLSRLLLHEFILEYGSIENAATALGVTRVSLYERIERLAKRVPEQTEESEPMTERVWIDCTECKRPFEREAALVRRNEREGVNNVCSPSCGARRTNRIRAKQREASRAARAAAMA